MSSKVYVCVCLTTVLMGFTAKANEPRTAKPADGTVRVAGIVLKWLRADKQANYLRAETMIREAARNGAQIVCTTECFLDGYAIADKSIPLEKYRALGEAIPDGPYFKRLSRLADELNIHLVAGMLEADGERRFNTAVMIGPDGKLVGRYHKQQLGHEAVRNTAGKVSSVFKTDRANIGMMICADRRYPKLVGRFRKRGADFLICPSGGMFGPARNDPIVQARSRENRRYIIFVHPAEFLVTGPDGSIVRRTILGKKLLIAANEVGTPADSKRVFYFDLPLAPAKQAPKSARSQLDILLRGGTVIDGTGKPQWAPKRQFGFTDNRYMFNRGHWKQFEDTPQGPRVKARKNGAPSYDVKGADEKSFATDWLSDKTIKYIDEHKDEPFCFMLSIPDPHGPDAVRAPYDTMFDDAEVRKPRTFDKDAKSAPSWAAPQPKCHYKMAQYHGMIKCIDDNVGRITKHLGKLGILDNTILIFTADHGDMRGEHRRQNKGVPLEASAKVPFVIRYPKAIKGGLRVDQVVNTVDFLPSMLAIMKVKTAGREEGRDCSALLTTEIGRAHV
mgnify:CR=1 FL=1